ncbi:MAG: HDIG domain-containing protein [Anaerolineaceae bacterium]|nr:HDIG domain-containing protein [Anaerolineaceae bacterium]
MDRNHALELVRTYVKNEGLIRHMLSVEAAMRWYAHKFGEDEEKWGLAGLLHDYDWEIHPTADTHPLEGLPLLRRAGISEEVLEAIASHADRLEHPRLTFFQKMLFACDEITGMITAVALVRPSKSLYDLEASSVKKKWKDKAFAAGAERSLMEEGAQEIGIELWQHVGNVIHAMRAIAPELGLAGTLEATQ